MDNLHSSPRLAKITDAIRNILKSKLSGSSEVWLYGSRARGDARDDSDWDLLVLLDKDKITIDDDRNITFALRMLGCEINEEINPQLFTFDEWNSFAFTPFNQNVINDRIRIA